MSGIEGAAWGLALGDALGAPVEFASVDDILARFPDGPQEPPGPVFRVTDDTQMALAVGRALERAFAEGWGPLTFEGALRDEFVAWLHDPENNRAPGTTCLRACGGLDRGQSWRSASIFGSKGCGANMRVTPIGALLGLSEDDMAGAAWLQAVMTHGHPTGLVASELTALAVRRLLEGAAPYPLLDELIARCTTHRTIYRERWVGDLWRRFGAASPEEYIAQGWDETRAVLERIGPALRSPPPRDACDVGGEGWIAEEALATGLYCFLMHPDDGLAAIRRAAITRGDTDSICCLAGAFAGARLGSGAWPVSWRERCEYREEILRQVRWAETQVEG